MRPDQAQQCGGLQPDGGGVVIRVDADASRRFQQGGVEIELDRTRLVVEQPERRDRAGRQVQTFPKLLSRGKAQRPQLLRAAEGLEVDALGSLYGNEIEILFFIVADEQIFGIRLGIGEGHGGQLGHGVDRRVLCDLKGHGLFAQKPVDRFFVHSGFFLTVCPRFGGRGCLDYTSALPRCQEKRGATTADKKFFPENCRL